MISVEDGTAAVRAARELIEAETEERASNAKIPQSFSEIKTGVFVTLNEFPSGLLRGCIGYPVHPFNLARALELSAKGVCYDQRFPPLKSKQAKACTVEVTFLTSPEMIEYSTLGDLKKQIEIGKDGLMVEYVRNKGLANHGLFLPQVPVEQGWNIDQYLSNICMKAGLQEDAWKSGALTFYKFQGEIYREKSPAGEVVTE